MGRLSELRVVDPVLTTLVRGYSNADFVAENLFPIVGVVKEAGKVPTFGKDAFKIVATERAIRGNSNKIAPETRSTVDYACVEHDAVYPADYREIQEDILDLQKYAAFRAQAAVKLRCEKICADLALDAANYASTNKVTLSGTTQWTHASSLPIAAVRTACEAVRTQTGKRPNVMILGALAFLALQDHATITDRIKYSQLGVVTTELLAQIFGLKKVIVGDGVYSNDAMTAVYDIWGDNAVLAYVPEASGEMRSIYEPSYGYTLQKTGMPEVDTYLDEGGKITNVRSTDIFIPKIVGADAGYLIKDTNA